MAALTATITDGIGVDDPGSADAPVEWEPIGVEDSGTADMLAEFDAVGLTDSISTSSLAGQWLRTITDPVGLDDHGDGSAYQPERMGLTDTVTAVVTGGVVRTDAVGVQDSIEVQTTGTGTYVVTITEHVGVSDTRVVDRTVNVRQRPGSGRVLPPPGGGPFPRTPSAPYEADPTPSPPYRTGAT